MAEQGESTQIGFVGEAGSAERIKVNPFIEALYTMERNGTDDETKLLYRFVVEVLTLEERKAKDHFHFERGRGQYAARNSSRKPDREGELDVSSEIKLLYPAVGKIPINLFDREYRVGIFGVGQIQAINDEQGRPSIQISSGCYHDRTFSRDTVCSTEPDPSKAPLNRDSQNRLTEAGYVLISPGTESSPGGVYGSVFSFRDSLTGNLDTGEVVEKAVLSQLASRNLVGALEAVMEFEQKVPVWEQERVYEYKVLDVDRKGARGKKNGDTLRRFLRRWRYNEPGISNIIDAEHLFSLLAHGKAERRGSISRQAAMSARDFSKEVSDLAREGFGWIEARMETDYIGDPYPKGVTLQRDIFFPVLKSTENFRDAAVSPWPEILTIEVAGGTLVSGKILRWPDLERFFTFKITEAIEEDENRYNVEVVLNFPSKLVQDNQPVLLVVPERIRLMSSKTVLPPVAYREPDGSPVYSSEPTTYDRGYTSSFEYIDFLKREGIYDQDDWEPRFYETRVFMKKGSRVVLGNEYRNGTPRLVTFSRGAPVFYHSFEKNGEEEAQESLDAIAYFYKNFARAYIFPTPKDIM